MTSLAEMKQRGDDGEPLVDLNDLCTMNELLLVEMENRRRAQEK